MKSKKTLIVLLIILVLASLATTSGTAYFFYTKYQKAQKLLQNPTEAAKEETTSVLAKVGKLMDLPTGEQPTIATILDPSKLKDQPFFAKAKNGDKVILYANVRKAILFRPGENKIIDVAPINIGTQSAQQPQTPPIKIAFYNGTENLSITQKAEKQLKDKYVDIEVAQKVNAKNTNYEKTLIVDLTGTKKEIAEALAKELNGETAALPEAETKPADSQIEFLVILGKNYK